MSADLGNTTPAHEEFGARQERERNAAGGANRADGR